MWVCDVVLIISVTSLFSAKEVESRLFGFDFLNRSNEEITCKYNQWQCGDGHCISKYNICNGVADCYDGSDEAVQTCSMPQPEKNITCVLPPYPDHGTYVVSNFLDAQPGEAYASFSLKVICQRGHGVMEPFDDGGGTVQVYCINGDWSQNMPKCVRFCKLDPDPSIRYLCFSRTGVEVCKKYLPPGTSIEPVCNSPIYYSTEIFAKMKCSFGYWNYVAVCKAECGRIIPNGTQLVLGGTPAKRGEIPWHAGIYRKTTIPYVQICGGSLVSNNVVISAAHCFWNGSGKLLSASEFGVATGNLYRSWEDDKDAGAQKSDVKEIKIPVLFQGAAANFQEDIAVVVLSTPVTYTTNIRPVCLNFDLQFNRLQLQHGRLGKVAGWGLTAANGNVSATLRVVDIPLVNMETCISTVPLWFRESITGDKFCAGYTNGTAALCQGDSGGGLAFSDKELGIDRYYLRGVASAAPPADDKLCNDNTYITFTKITDHQEFLQEALAASVAKTCSLYSFQCSDGSCVDPGSECNGKPDCADGSDESVEHCLVDRTRILFKQPPQSSNFENPVTRPSKLPTPHPVQQLNSQRMQAPPALRTLHTEVQSTSESNTECASPGDNENVLSFQNGRTFDRTTLPWMVVIFKESKYGLRYQCVGTLISNKHVVIKAYFVYDYKFLKRFLLKLGVGYTFENFDDTNLVTRRLTSVSISKLPFDIIYDTNEIAILTLNNPVEFNMFIRPACLWNGDSEPFKVVGYSSVFGWGSLTYGNHPIGTLRISTLPIVSTEECRASYHIFHNYTSDKTLCVGYRDGSNPCLAAYGGGLFVLQGGQYRLRGVHSFSLAANFTDYDKTCILDNYLIFTDIVQYLPWIKKVISET